MPCPTHPDHALATVRDYHVRTKHDFQAYARGPGTLDWDAQPAPFRHFDGAPPVTLPRLSAVQPGTALDRVLRRPFGTLDAPVPALAAGLETLGALLQLSLGLTAWKQLGPDRWAVRANPSSGNLHPTEAYLLVSGIDGLADGLYHYRPEHHALEWRARHSQAMPGPAAAILLSSVIWREAWKYGERAFRYCQLDAGHAVGALRYAAGVLGWTLCAQPQVGSDTLARLAGLDRVQDFPTHRHPETEQEEPELLLSLGLDGGPAPPVLPLVLQAVADSAEWFGAASPIDRQPMYRWPVLDDVARATRQPDQAPASEPAVRQPPGRPRDGGPPVGRVLLGRRSAQRFDHHHQLPLAQFTALIERLHPVAGMPWDALPDSPRIALLLFVTHVEELEPGLYLLPRAPGQLADLGLRLDPGFDLLPVDGIAELLRLRAFAPQALQRLARSLHCHQELAANACFAVGMLAEFDAALAEGGAPAYRALYREAGLIGQLLYLEAEALGLRGTGIGCFFDDPVHQLLGLTGTSWQSLYHFTIGRPIADPRIESTPAYTDDCPTASGETP